MTADTLFNINNGSFRFRLGGDNQAKKEKVKIHRKMEMINNKKNMKYDS